MYTVYVYILYYFDNLDGQITDVVNIILLLYTAVYGKVLPINLIFF